jgi:hypothetical protein
MHARGGGATQRQVSMLHRKAIEDSPRIVFAVAHKGSDKAIVVAQGGTTHSVECGVAPAARYEHEVCM